MTYFHFSSNRTTLLLRHLILLLTISLKFLLAKRAIGMEITAPDTNETARMRSRTTYSRAIMTIQAKSPIGTLTRKL
jgi:hypothetical protein